MNKAPSKLHVAEKIGPRQLDYQNKKDTKKMKNQSRAFGLITLYVKINFLVAGITLWRMPLIGILPLYQIVGSTVLAVIVYLELKPYFSERKTKKPKKNEPIKSNMTEAGLDFIEE